MTVLAPIPDAYPDPDCGHCHGEGVPQSAAHALLGDAFSNKACPHCHEDEEKDDG